MDAGGRVTQEQLPRMPYAANVVGVSKFRTPTDLYTEITWQETHTSIKSSTNATGLSF